MYVTVDELEKLYKRSMKSLPRWVLDELSDKKRIEDNCRQNHRSAQQRLPPDRATRPENSAAPDDTPGR